jgi:uncharacterized protein (DUF2249 family)
MPITIPRYEPQAQQEQSPNARFTADPSREAFGGGQSAEKLTNASTDLAKTILDEKRKADEIVVTDFNTKLTQLKNNLIYDPQTGLMTRKGKDAFSAPEEYHQRFDKEADKLQEGLSSDYQRNLAARARESQKSDLDTAIQRHVFNESKTFEEETTTAALQAGQDDAVLNYHDPNKLQNALDGIKGTLYRWADRNGIPQNSDILKQKLEDMVSKTHTGVIERMLANGEDLKAKGYYDQNKSEVSGKDATLLEKALEEGAIRGESQRKTDEIMSKGLSMSQALEESKKVEDPKLRDALRDRIHQEFTLKEAALRDAQEKNHIQALNVIDQTKSIDKVQSSPMWQSFSQAERTGLISYARAKAEGVQPVTSWDDYYNLKSMASAPATRDEFVKTNLMEYRPKLADSEFKQLVDLQTSLRNGDNKASQHLDGIRSDMDIVNSVLADAGVNTKAKPGTDAAKKANLFRSKVDAEVMKLQERSGKKATNEDIKRISDNLIIEGQTDDGIFGSGLFVGKKRLFEVNPETDKFVIQAKDVPASERAKIESALRRHGQKVTDENILMLYKKKIGGVARGQ